MDRETRLFRRAMLNALMLIGYALLTNSRDSIVRMQGCDDIGYVRKNTVNAYAEFMNETEETD